MKLPFFIYIVVNILLLQILSLGDYYIINSVYLLCLLGIFTVGISHGAIDDILHQKTIKVNNKAFISKYLIAISIYFLFWMIAPNLATIGFILISGYHFGQSQFIEYKVSNKIISKLLYLSWGTLIIVLLFFFNKEYLLLQSQNYSNVPSALPWMIDHSGILTIISASILSSVLIYNLIIKKISIERFSFEIILLIVISFSFSLLDPFISFSLFFIILHSLQAMRHEMKFFKSHLKIKSTAKFIKEFVPFTFISIAGFGAILIAMSLLGYNNYIPFMILILISSITAPHSFVMNEFYASDEFQID